MASNSTNVAPTAATGAGSTANDNTILARNGSNNDLVENGLEGGNGPGGPERKRQKLDFDVASATPTGTNGQKGEDLTEREEVVSLYVELEPIPGRTPRISPLEQSEVEELEAVLEFGDSGDADSNSGWRDDWAGNLAFVDMEIRNPQVKSGKQSYRQTMLEWAKNNSKNTRLVWNLIRYVCQMKETPVAAKRLLLSCDPTSVPAIEKAVRRTSYDPTVLQQDGWTTSKSPTKGKVTGTGASWSSFR